MSKYGGRAEQSRTLQSISRNVIQQNTANNKDHNIILRHRHVGSRKLADFCHTSDVALGVLPTMVARLNGIWIGWTDGSIAFDFWILYYSL
eukprot:scaffold37761_cov214-Amphora_coffeaeformis.AAC.2